MHERVQRRPKAEHASLFAIQRSTQTRSSAALNFLVLVRIMGGVLSAGCRCAPYQTNQKEGGILNHYKNWKQRSRKKNCTGERRREKESSSLLRHNKLQLLRFLWEVQTGAISLQIMPAERLVGKTEVYGTSTLRHKGEEEVASHSPYITVAILSISRFKVCAFIKSSTD